jgi:hypothetical protein
MVVCSRKGVIVATLSVLKFWLSSGMCGEYDTSGAFYKKCYKLSCNSGEGYDKFVVASIRE